MSEQKNSVAEADQMMQDVSGWANAFLGNMTNGLIASKHGDPGMVDEFLYRMTDVLKPLNEIQLCCLVYELSQRLVAGMIDAVGGDIDNLRDAMDKGHVLGMTTNKEVAFRDLPPL